MFCQEVDVVPTDSIQHCVIVEGLTDSVRLDKVFSEPKISSEKPTIRAG